MTDTSDESVSVKIVLYPEDGEEKAIGQLGYGMQPFILLEAGADEEGGAYLKATGSLIDDFEELVDTLDGFADAIKEAVANHRAAQGAEVPE